MRRSPRRVGEETIVICQQVGEPFSLAAAYLFLGHACRALGAEEEATVVYQKVLEVWREQQITEGTLEPLAGLADLALQRGDRQQAQEHVDEILRLLPSAFLRHEAIHEPLRVYLTCYHVLSANQDPRAEEILQTANRLFREQVARIPDEEARRTFRENVPVHRELLKAVQQC